VLVGEAESRALSKIRSAKYEVFRLATRDRVSMGLCEPGSRKFTSDGERITCDHKILLLFGFVCHTAYMPQKPLVERIIAGVGSVPSLIIHTAIFSASFLLTAFGIVSLNLMLLVLTTVLSLEAIYLAIFIQMTVNRHGQELAEVSEGVEDLQEDIEEISQDVDEIQKDVDEIQEDVGEIQEDVEEINDEDETEEQHEQKQTAAIEQLTKDVRRLLDDLEQLKKG
jgi:uncharacterized protein YoxC